MGEGAITIADDQTTGEDSTERLNRDTDNTTKDLYSIDRQQGNVDLTIDTRLLTETGREEIKEEFEQFPESVQILAQNMPSASDDNPIVAALGAALDTLSDWTGGIIPSDKNNGGLIAQLPILLSADDNRFGNYQVRPADSDYVLANPDEFMPINQLPHYNEMLEGSDVMDANTQARMANIVVSRNPVTITEENATFQNGINGILNTLPQALVNLVQQTDSDTATSNYNPSHGVLGDLFESAIDKLFGNGGIETGIAQQAGQATDQTTSARGPRGSNFVDHSQGTAIRNAGVNDVIDNGGFSIFTDTYSQQEISDITDRTTYFINGPAVANTTMETTVTEAGFTFSGSNTNEGDAVGEGLGGNSGLYIPSVSDNNERLGIIESIGSLLINGYRLGGDKYPQIDEETSEQTNNTSPHSTYNCQAKLAQCGDLSPWEKK